MIRAEEEPGVARALEWIATAASFIAVGTALGHHEASAVAEAVAVLAREAAAAVRRDQT
jgi:hypothetical protein